MIRVDDEMNSHKIGAVSGHRLDDSKALILRYGAMLLVEDEQARSVADWMSFPLGVGLKKSTTTLIVALVRINGVW